MQRPGYHQYSAGGQRDARLSRRQPRRLARHSYSTPRTSACFATTATTPSLPRGGARRSGEDSAIHRQHTSMFTNLSAARSLVRAQDLSRGSGCAPGRHYVGDGQSRAGACCRHSEQIGPQLLHPLAVCCVNSPAAGSSRGHLFGRCCCCCCCCCCLL